VDCAKIYVPFYAKCAPVLQSVPGLNLDSILDLCQGAGSVGGVAMVAPSVGGFYNGGFEHDDVCNHVCQTDHEVASLDGTLCGYEYLEPAGWSGGGTVLVCNTNSAAWGGLNSQSGRNYLSIQGSNSYIEQTVAGLTSRGR
jgi:hypothetical protein